MISWLRRIQRRLQREGDKAVLWVELQSTLDTREEAEWVFRQHMETDPAYSDMTDIEKKCYVENLP